jgi:hypothetical protein
VRRGDDQLPRIKRVRGTACPEDAEFNMGKHHSTKFGVRIAMSSISAVVELLAVTMCGREVKNTRLLRLIVQGRSEGGG